MSRYKETNSPVIVSQLKERSYNFSLVTALWRGGGEVFVTKERPQRWNRIDLCVFMSPPRKLPFDLCCRLWAQKCTKKEHAIAKPMPFLVQHIKVFWHPKKEGIVWSIELSTFGLSIQRTTWNSNWVSINDINMVGKRWSNRSKLLFFINGSNILKMKQKKK